MIFGGFFKAIRNSKHSLPFFLLLQMGSESIFNPLSTLTFPTVLSVAPNGLRPFSRPFQLWHFQPFILLFQIGSVHFEAPFYFDISIRYFCCSRWVHSIFKALSTLTFPTTLSYAPGRFSAFPRHFLLWYFASFCLLCLFFLLFQMRKIFLGPTAKVKYTSSYVNIEQSLIYVAIF